MRHPAPRVLLGALVLSACGPAPHGPAPMSVTGSAPSTSTVTAAAPVATAKPTHVSSRPAPPPYLAGVRHERRAGVDTVTLTPTPAGRTVADADLVWRELVRSHADLDSPSLHDQVVCHVMFAASKPVWHVEPGRPAVGLAATIAAGCNPGSEPDPDIH